MEQRLSDPDLDQIEGLLGLVRDHAWDAHASLRVSDMLYHMLSLYRRTHQKAGDAWRDNDAIRRELDGSRQDLRERIVQLRDREDRLDDAFRRLDSRENYIDELRSRVEDLEAELTGLRKEREAALRSDHSRSHRVVRQRMNDPYRPEDYCEQPKSGSRRGTPRSPQYNPSAPTPVTPGCNPASSSARSPQYCHGQIPTSHTPLLSRSQHFISSHIVSPANLLPAALPDGNGATKGGEGAPRVENASNSAPGTTRGGRQYPFYKTLKSGEPPGSATGNFRKKMASKDGSTHSSKLATSRGDITGVIGSSSGDDSK